MEVLIATALASVVLAAAAGLIAASARAVADSELETTATWLATRAIEGWRSLPSMPAEGTRRADRDGRLVPAAGLYTVSWSARVDTAAARLWRVSVVVTSPRLREPVVVEAIVTREMP